MQIDESITPGQAEETTNLHREGLSSGTKDPWFPLRWADSTEEATVAAQPTCRFNELRNKNKLTGGPSGHYTSTYLLELFIQKDSSDIGHGSAPYRC